MNKLLTALFVASLAGPLLSSSAVAGAGFYEDAMVIARKSIEQDREEERDQRKESQEFNKKKRERAEQEQEDRRYGYGYERRNPEKFERPGRNFDSRGRR